MPLRHPSGAIDGIVIIAREASRRSSQRERDRIALLERIGERLAGSLELGMTLRQVAETLVPQFADHCFIDLFQGDKLVRRVQMHAGGWTPPPGTWATVGDPIRYPEGHFCQQAMARLDAVAGRRTWTRCSRPGRRARAAWTPPSDVGLRSVVAAPLIARGELLGVMSLALSRLTERARAVLRRGRPRLPQRGREPGRGRDRQRDAVRGGAPHRAGLPDQPAAAAACPHLDGLEVACRYVPAKPLETHGQGIQTQVGGDWYDIIPLSAGRVGIVIGDVEGRGARAAAVMGQLRAALRAFAQDDKPPAEILRKLDDWCRTLGPAKAAPDRRRARTRRSSSCTYLVYDAWSRDAVVRQRRPRRAAADRRRRGRRAGDRAQGACCSACAARASPGLPTYREETRYLPAGSALVLYTDGLTDRRHRARRRSATTPRTRPG